MQPKRKPALNINSRTFGFAWIGWSAIAWAIVGIVASLNEFNDLNLIVQVMIVFGLAGILLSRVQAFLLQRRISAALKLWVPVSNLSWIIGSSTIYALMHYQMGSDQTMQMVFGAIFAIPALTQAWLLRHRVPQSWLWALAGAVSGIIFMVPILALERLMNDSLWLILGSGGALVGLIQVLVLDRMLAARQEKSKHAMYNASVSHASQHLALADEDEVAAGWKLPYAHSEQAKQGNRSNIFPQDLQ
ncbi:MAG: hypothetical protein KC496_03405 [Anaerolineae bacterium]|nr:hypothetical protein [Anaerolineae bacterium]